MLTITALGLTSARGQEPWKEPAFPVASPQVPKAPSGQSGDGTPAAHRTFALWSLSGNVDPLSALG